MIDDTINQTARRVAIHQAVDKIVDGMDARRRLFGDETASNTLSAALNHLSAVALNDHPYAIEGAWQALAAIAQGQLEQAMEERAR